MDDKLKEDISKIVDEAVSSRISSQQTILIFNLDDFDAERKLKQMLNVENYHSAMLVLKYSYFVSSTKQKQSIFVLLTGQRIPLIYLNTLFCFQNALYLQYNRNKIKK